MSRVLLMATGIRSPLNAMLALGEQLRALGHEVGFVAPNSAAPSISAAGFATFEIPVPMVTTFNALLPRPTKRERFSLEARKRRIAHACEAFGIAALNEHLATFAPDLVICDPEMHAHVLVSLGLGYRVALATTIFPSRPAPQAPPLHYHLEPGKGVRGTPIAIRLAWLHYLTRKTLVVGRNGIRDWGADHPSALAALARRHGVDLRAICKPWTWLMPWSYALPTVALVPQALDLPGPHSRQVTYLGPMLRSPDPKDNRNDPAVDWYRAPTAPAVKRVFAAFGTMVRPHPALVKALCEIARRRPSWRLLCVTRDAEALQTRLAPPENLRFAPWAPQRDLLNVTDLAVIHGGSASVFECVDAEVPMLIHPICNDQCGNAARVAFHGLGIMGRQTDSAAMIERDMATLLDDGTLPTRLRQMKDTVTAETQSPALAQFLDALLPAQKVAA